jgi:hypothetical protein
MFAIPVFQNLLVVLNIPESAWDGLEPKLFASTPATANVGLSMLAPGDSPPTVLPQTVLQKPIIKKFVPSKAKLKLPVTVHTM